MVKKLLSIVISLVMMMTIVQTMGSVVYGEELINVTEIKATINYQSVAVYGGKMKNPSYSITSGDPAKINVSIGSGGRWQKKNEDGSWSTYSLFYTTYYFTAGIWRYVVPVTVTTTSGVLDSNFVIYVNNVEWDHSKVTTYNNNACYYSDIYSPEYEIKEPDELSFVDQNSYDIVSYRSGSEISSFSVASGVAGGVQPYTFSKVSGPEWLIVSTAGRISGTAGYYGANDDLVVRVTDSFGNYKEITIAVADTLKSIEELDHISSINLSIDSGSIPQEGRTVRMPSIQVINTTPSTSYEIKHFSGMTTYGTPCWQKKVDGEWVDVANGQVFEKGIYRYHNAIIGGSYAEIYFDSDCSVTFNEVPGTVQAGNSLLNWYYYGICVQTPEYCVHDLCEVPIVKATETSNGVKAYYKCDICDELFSDEKGTNTVKTDELEISKISSVELSEYTYTYDGSIKNPTLTVKDATGKILVEGTDYSVSTPSDRISVGTYTYKVVFEGNYSGTTSVSFIINTASIEKPGETANPDDNITPTNSLKSQKITTAKINKIKAKTLKKKAVIIKLKAKTDGKGKLTYKVSKYPKKMKKFIKVSKTGVVTFKKKTKKGTYKITITAAAKGNYKKTTKVVTIKVK